jgi:hypothetical protein
MAEETITTRVIRNYLLGRGSESEAEKIEGMYFADSQGLDEVWATFADLVEEYLRGDLSEVESRFFEQRLRSSPAFREIFETEKALYKYSANTTKGVSPQTDPHPTVFKTGGKRRFPGLAFVKTWGLAFAGIFALFAFMLWFALQSRARLHPLSPTLSQQTKAPDQKSPDKIAPSPIPPQETPQIAGPANTPPANETKSPKGGVTPGIIATYLFPAAPVRDSQPELTLKIQPQTRFLQLEFELAGDDCPVFSAVLRTESDQPLGHWEKLRPRRDYSTPRITLRVRAELLENAAYVVTTQCANGRENPTSTQQYRFRVER